MSSEELLKKISLKTTKHSTGIISKSSSTSLGSQKQLQNRQKKQLQQGVNKKRRQVKKNDIMEMIYPSYRDSFKQAVSSMQQTLRGSQKPIVKKQLKHAQQDLSAQVLAVSSARVMAKLQDPKNLTVVKENREEDEEDSQHFISRRPTEGVPQAGPELEVRDSTIEYIENIEEESLMDFRKLEKWVEKSGEKTAAETPEKEEMKEEQEETQEQRHERIIKERIVANKFGASFGHQKAKIQDLVKGDEMCRSFALALLKHIEFSQGAFHIDDLNMEVDEPDALQFSYNLGNSLLKFKKQKKPEKEEDAKRANSRNFEELERRLASSQESKKEEKEEQEKTSPLQGSSSPFDSPGGKQEEEVLEEEILEYLSDKEEAPEPRKTHTAKTVEEIIVKEEEVVQDDEGTQGDIDFDYTETQLEDFLSSYKETGGFENLRDSKVKTSTLISSFLRSLNRFNSNSQKNISVSRKITMLEPIESHSEESPDGKSPSPLKKKQSRMTQPPPPDSDEDDDLERDPVSPSIDLKKDMDTIARQVPAFQIKPVEAVQSMSVKGFEAPVGEENKKNATDLVIEGDNQHYLKVRHGRPLRPDQTLLESQYQVPKDTKANVRQYLLQTMKIFDQNYNYEEQRVMGEYPPPFWGNPVQDELFEFCHYILIVSKMETEIPILALAYIERLLLKTGLLLNFSNWRKLVLTTMILASKIWDDDSFQNQHFAQVFPQFTLKEINALERTLLELLEYNLMIKGSEYAKFFFLLRTLYDTKYKKGGVGLPMVPMVDGLQKKTLKAGDILKGRHQLDRTL